MSRSGIVSRRWALAAVLWAVIIIGFGVSPTQKIVDATAPNHEDTATSAGHFVEYALFSGLLVLAGHERDENPRRHIAVVAVLAAVLLGLAIELIQAVLPYRDFQLLDLLLNAVGATVGAVVVSAVRAALDLERGRRA